MASFEPRTTIYLCRTGIDRNNKPYFEDNTTMGTWVISKSVKTFTFYSYQRGDERQYCAVDAPYDECIKCDTIAYNNDATFWVIGNITGCEFKNPNCTWVYFEIDPFCTFCGDIDWAHSYSMVEREHVVQDWNGNVPNWSVQGVAEPIRAEPKEIVSATLSPDYGSINFVCVSPYDSAGNPNIAARNRYGIFEGLTQISSTSASAISSYLSTLLESSRGSAQDVVGIWSVPDRALADIATPFQVGSLQAPWSENRYNLNNAKCFSGQYCILNIESMVGDSKSYSPELLQNAAAIIIMANAVFAGGVGSLTCFPEQYAGRSGEEFAASITEFPQGSWVSNAYAEWLTSNTLNIMGRIVGSIANADINTGAAAANAAGASAGAGAGAAVAISGLTSMYNIAADAQPRMKGSAVVGGGMASPSVVYAMGAGHYDFKARFYMPTENELKSIDSFYDVFGYRVMRLKVPERNTRPCWNYIKTIDGHIHSNCPATYIRQMEEIMNEGMTFWNVSAREIGDYSNPQANKS